MEDNFLPDNQLDDLFKEAAAGFRPSFDEAAWQSMSARLDQQKQLPTPQKSKWQNVLWLLLLLIPTAWWVTFQANSTKSQLSTTKRPFISQLKVQQAIQKLSVALPVQTTTPRSFIKTDKNSITFLINNDNIPKSLTIQKSVLNLKKTNNKPANDLNTEALQTADYQHTTENLLTFGSTKTELEPLNIKGLTLIVNLANPVIAQAKSQTESMPATTSSPIIKRPVVGLRLMAATDVNSVGATGGFKDLGQSIGVLLEYEVAKRWKIQTGFIKSNKNYVAPLQDYTLPETSTWSMGIKPAQVEAQCEILDIPLNIRFDAIRQGKHDFFVNTGLSSYLMVSEKYHYDYDANYGYMLKGSLLQDRQLYRSSDYLFSTFNLSMGYERQLKHGFSFQIEPYLKTPLKGVGWGSINLYSTGIILSLKHGL